jgi:hypothetical protein
MARNCEESRGVETVSSRNRQKPRKTGESSKHSMRGEQIARNGEDMNSRKPSKTSKSSKRLIVSVLPGKGRLRVTQLANL